MKWFDRIEEGLLVCSLSVMVIINFGNVLSRYIFHASWSFSEELLVIFFVYNSFLGAALACRRGAHMGFTVLTSVFPEKLKKSFVVFSTVISLILMGVLVLYGAEMVCGQVEYEQRTPALGLPEAVAGFSVPFGALLIAIRMVQACVAELRQIQSFSEK
ncbi:MAG: C4-dicarboxylate ABC transporter permease [Dethiosulfovibrio peptidovorans]|nr:MAG: C4-dicarboxylate ABC transporter permease [Dethiosulfovibrio peptidovorans]